VGNVHQSGKRIIEREERKYEIRGRTENHDLNAIFLSNTGSVFSHFSIMRFAEFSKIKYLDVIDLEIGSHLIDIDPTRDDVLNNNTVLASD